MVSIKNKSEIKEEKEASFLTRNIFVFYEYVTHNRFQMQHLKAKINDVQ